MVAVVVTRRCSILTKLSIIIYVWVIANGSILTVEGRYIVYYSAITIRFN